VTPRRHPHLVLGIDVGAPADEARRAFARASRQLRRAEGAASSAWTLEDLTWALHQVEQIHTDPEAGLDLLRVPADPSVFGPAGPGVLDPAPPGLPRRTPAPTAAELDQVAVAALVELATTLLGTRADHLRAGEPYTVVPPPPAPYPSEEPR
jgi:hypothetical protein